MREAHIVDNFLVEVWCNKLINPKAGNSVELVLFLCLVTNS